MSERRRHPRTPAKPRVPVVCEIARGDTTIEAVVVDISLGGIGTLVYDPSIQLDPGTRLAGARIHYPKREPFVVNMEVRHVALVTLPDGLPANRAGCRLIGAQEDIEELVRLFLADL